MVTEASGGKKNDHKLQQLIVRRIGCRLCSKWQVSKADDVARNYGNAETSDTYVSSLTSKHGKMLDGNGKCKFPQESWAEHLIYDESGRFKWNLCYLMIFTRIIILFV